MSSPTTFSAPGGTLGFGGGISGEFPVEEGAGVAGRGEDRATAAGACLPVHAQPRRAIGDAGAGYGDPRAAGAPWRIRRAGDGRRAEDGSEGKRGGRGRRRGG